MARAILIAAVLFGFAVTTSTPLRAEDVRAGIGRSKSEPVGQPFVLPEGVTIGEPIGAYIEDHCFPDDQDEQLREGHGANIRMCVGFTNTSPTAVSVRLPAGLVFVSFDTRSQNGLLIQTETFEVPPGDSPYFVSLALQCLNANRSTGRARDTYRVGPITQDQSIQHLIQLLAGKTLTEEHIPEVQNALWSITDGQGLQARDLEALGAIQ